MSDFTSLERQIGVTFENKDLLKQAVAHRSYLNEHPEFELDHNERLEFLGDAVLEIIVTEYLFNTYPDTPEGELTNWRASLVNSKMLAKVAQRISLNDHLLLSKGESKDKGRARQYILANTIEALIGALYLDQGYATVEKFINKNIIVELPQILAERTYRDPKSKFQEEAQDRVNVTPVYQVLKEWGPDHAKKFKVGVFLKDELIAEGEGVSKQEAQTKAAQQALTKKGWQK